MSVYLYRPPTWRNATSLEGALIVGVTTSTVVYRQEGEWFNVAVAGMDNPDPAQCDMDTRTGLRLFFDKPMVVPGSLHDELAAVEPADTSWTPGSLTLL